MDPVVLIPVKALVISVVDDVDNVDVVVELVTGIPDDDVCVDGIVVTNTLFGVVPVSSLFVVVPENNPVSSVVICSVLVVLESGRELGVGRLV